MALPNMVRSESQSFKIQSVPAWQGVLLVCCQCGEHIGDLSFQVTNAQRGTFCCGRCACTQTKMWRINGRGSRKFLQCMSEPERQQWMREAQSADKSKLIHMMQTAVTKYCQREKRFSYGGAFKPLSVWETLGYDTAIIARESLPEDVRGDRMFGLVYRVPELLVEQVGRDGKRNETTERLESKRRRLKARVNDPDAAGEPAASEAGEVRSIAIDIESSESSESSASSGSTETGKEDKAAKKKRKQEKKEKKRAAKEKRKQIEAQKREKAAKKEAEKAAKAAAAQQAKAAKDQERQRERAAEKAKTTAKAAATKIEKALNRIQSTLRKPGSHLVPELSKLPLQQCLAAFEDHLVTLNRIKIGDCNDDLEIPDVKKLIADAKKHEALFSATIRTYGGPARGGA